MFTMGQALCSQWYKHYVHNGTSTMFTMVHTLCSQCGSDCCDIFLLWIILLPSWLWGL